MAPACSGCSQDPNLNAILETLTDNGARTIMAQRYIPEIVKGDKRILLIGGEPVPYCLARIPLAGETRGNLAAGGRGVASRCRRATARSPSGGAQLAARGLLLVGLDVIGDYVTEVNVTSPPVSWRSPNRPASTSPACSRRRSRKQRPEAAGLLP